MPGYGPEIFSVGCMQDHQKILGMTFYFKRFWDETTGDPLTDSWGTSTFYFETDESGEVLRQLQIFSNGSRLKYDANNLQDEYGALSDALLDLAEFEEYKITKNEFDKAWQQ